MDMNTYVRILNASFGTTEITEMLFVKNPDSSTNMGSADDQVRGGNDDEPIRDDEIAAGSSDQTFIQSELKEQIDKEEEQILKMEASVFQLANYYFVFAGVLLAAIVRGSNSGALKCGHFWLPFALSLVGAILNFFSLLTISYKYMESLDQLDNKTLKLYHHFFKTTSKELETRHRRKKSWRRAMLAGSMILFFAFVVLNLVGTWLIPCRS